MGRGMLCATPIGEALLCVWYAARIVSSRGRGEVYQTMPNIHDFPDADKLRKAPPSEGEFAFEDDFLAAGFTQIPNVVLRMPGLSSDAKLVYAGLLSYAWRDRSCYPGHKRLAEDLSLSRHTVMRRIKELESVGLVVVTHRRYEGKTNLYLFRSLNRFLGV